MPSSDLFAPSERGRAFAVYGSGVKTGIFLSYLLGSWVSDNFGWRSVFLAVGIPGVALAVVVRLTLAELPPRRAGGRGGRGRGARGARSPRVALESELAPSAA